MKVLTTTILCIGSLICPAETHADSLVYEGESGIGKDKHIVVVANDPEYRSEQTCPTLAKQVFGNTWHKERGQTHYGTNHVMGCRITAVDSALKHPILTGVRPIHAYSGAYESRLPTDATPLLEVQVLNTFGPSDDLNKDKPIVNAGWTREYYVAPSGTKKDARIVYTSFGASEDLLSEDARRFLTNACLWASGWEDKITADLDVSLVGGYSPSPYNGGAFWYEGVKPVDLVGWDSQVMPASASLGGVDNPQTARRSGKVLENRHELKAKLVTLHPELYGPGAKLLPEPPKKKQ
jgi:hypothetical protein